MEDRKIASEHQNIILKNRRKLLISGVRDVESFNEECIVVETELGTLVVRGSGLHINKLNIESAELDVEGDVACCEYIDSALSNNRGGLFSGLFR